MGGRTLGNALRRALDSRPREPPMPPSRSRAPLPARSTRAPAPGPARIRPRGVLAAALAALALAASAPAREAGADAWDGPKPRRFSVGEVIEIIRRGEGPVIIDSRSHGEYLEGHIPTALNVPHKETWGRIDELRRFADRGIVFYCVKGVRSRIAAEGLLLEGFPKIGVMQGHLEEWKRRELPLVH